jgi:hypothetical protein
MMSYELERQRTPTSLNFDIGVSPIRDLRSAASALLLVSSNGKKPLNENCVFDKNRTPPG